MNTTNAATPQSAGNPAGTVASAADAEAICAAIEQLMEPLKAVVEAETRYLKAMDIAEAELLQDDKKDLAGAYIREITRYKALAAEVRRLAPGQVEKLARKRSIGLALSPTRRPDFHAWANAAERELGAPVAEAS